MLTWIVWFLAITSVVSVVGLLVAKRRTVETSEVVVSLAALVYATACVLGYFVTAWSSPTLATWREALLVRVLWLMIGDVLMVGAIFVSAWHGETLRKPAVWVLAASIGIVPLLCARNAWLDLRQGPVTLRLEGPDGYGATAARDELAKCHDPSSVRVTVLAHVERVVQVTCN